jgi:hypothetical protein
MTLLFNTHLPQIISKAKEYSCMFNMNQEDLINQGVLIFQKTIRSYDPKLCNYNTWLYLNLDWRLHRYCVKNRFDLAEFLEDQYYARAFLNISKKQIAFSNMMMDLSFDSHQIVDIVINQDNLPTHISKKSRLSQKTLRKYLLKTKRWKNKRIDKCFNEIKKALRNL